MALLRLLPIIPDALLRLFPDCFGSFRSDCRWRMLAAFQPKEFELHHVIDYLMNMECNITLSFCIYDYKYNILVKDNV